MVKRHHQIDFASGALVFPGGKIEAGDADPAWEALVLGWAAHDPQIRALKIAAVREAFEESGVLLARERDGSDWKATEAAAACRDKIAKGEMAFLDLVKSLGVVLDLDGMATFARWITPKGMPKRFDAYFYIAVAPADQLAVCRWVGDGGCGMDRPARSARSGGQRPAEDHLSHPHEPAASG